jgi:hypothetical protein
MKHLLCIGITALLLFSCSDLSSTEHIQKIEALEKAVLGIQTTVQNHPVDTLLSMSQHVANVEKRIKAHYKEEVIDMVFARKMDDYKALRKSYKPLMKAYSQLKAGATEELVALSNLKKDIQNGDGERNNYAEFISFEANKVAQLTELLTSFLEEKEKSLETYERLHQEMTDFSFELQNKNQAQE